MENRKKLHDYGLAIIFVGILNLFMLSATFIAGTIDGSAAEAMATVAADEIGAVKAVLGITVALMVLPIVADILLGVKALNVSITPKADKGYITVATVFMVLSVLSTIYQVYALFGGNAPVMEVVLNTASSTLSVCVYALFIKAANAVRKDVLGEKIQ